MLFKKTVPFAVVFLLAISAMAGEQTLTINSCQVKDFAVIKTDSGWNFGYVREFNNDATVAWGKELQLNPSGWKNHPQVPHINGYNGDITLKIAAPGPIAELNVESQLANFADDKTRKGVISYSINGIDYNVIAEKEFGITTISGSQKLPANSGLLWLRFSRIVEADDSNGLAGYVVFKRISFKLNGSYAAEKRDAPAAAVTSERTGLKDFFPTGVFWPWELTKPNADFAGKELWTFVEETMKTLHNNNCNAIWFVNIGPGEDARKLCTLAEKHQLKVLLNTDLLLYYYHGFDSFDSMENAARKTTNSIGDCPALIGYILKDEPLFCSLAHCNYFYKLIKRIDQAKRDSIVVAMNRQTPSFLEETELPVICTDIYYFGADKSTNIPNPAKTSQQMFRLNVSGINLIADKHGKHSWLMPQMFAAVWGRHYRKGDKTIVEPGSYLHWRMPSDAETRWQIWEAMRCGSKGIIFYILYPPVLLWTPPDQVKQGTPEEKMVKAMDAQAASAASWKTQELTKTRLEMDSGEAALQAGGKPTPQMLVMGKAFGHLRKYSDLLNSRQKADFPVFFPSDESTQTATFSVPNKSQLRYGVIVNDDLDKTRKIKVLLPLNISSVKNLNEDKDLAIKSDNPYFKSCELELASGDGCLLEAEFVNNQPGMLLMHEDFAQFAHKVKLNQNAQIERFGAFGIEPFYGVKMTGDSAEPVFSIENLTNRKNADNTVFMNINNNKRQGVVYCMINGDLNGVEVKALTDSAKNGEQTNVAHLAESNSGKPSDKSAMKISNKIQADKFYIPAVVPVGTTSLEFFIKNNVSRIDGVTIWFVPDVK